MGSRLVCAAAVSVLLAVGHATEPTPNNQLRAAPLAGFVPAMTLGGHPCSPLNRLARTTVNRRAVQCGRRIAQSMTSAADQATPGPPTTKAISDPFLACQPDMRRLKLKIKGVINKKLGSGENAHPLLKSSSREFFERSEKTWRPMAPLLLSRAFAPTAIGAPVPAHHDDAMVIAEIVEIMHTSSVIHDTVLEDYEAFEKGNMAHRIYSSSIAGNKISILAGDFLLSRASVLLSSLRNTEIVEIMAGALEQIMLAQMQLHRPVDNVALGMDAYVSSLNTRTGDLVACGCQCAAMVAGHERNSDVASAAFDYGLNLGVSYQIVKDLQVTEANYDKLFNKMKRAMEAASDTSDKSPPTTPIKFDPYELNEPLQRAGALMYAVDKHPELAHVARVGFNDFESLLAARQLVIKCKAMEGVRARADMHRDLAIGALTKLPDSDSKEALESLATMLTQPTQCRLARVNYNAEGVYQEPEEQALKSGTQMTRVLQDATQGLQLGMFSMRAGAKIQDAWSQVSAQVELAKDKLRTKD